MFALICAVLATAFLPLDAKETNVREPGIHILPSSEGATSRLSLSYHVPGRTIRNREDVRDSWSALLFQTLLNQSVGQFEKIKQETTTHKQALPLESLSFTLDSSEEDLVNTMVPLLCVLGQLEQEGFTEEQLSAAKADAIARIHAMQADGDSFWIGTCANKVALSCEEFIHMSLEVIPMITLADVSGQGKAHFKKQCLEIFLPPLSSAEETVKTHAEYALSKMTSKHPIFSFRNTTLLDGGDPFVQLPLDDREKKLIHKILTTMADNNILKLAMKKKSMEKKGKQINHVHPLKFMGYVFSDSHLKYCMAEIKSNPFKWHGFIDGFSKRIREEYDKEMLEPYIPGFSESLGLNPDDVRRYLRNRDWEGFVRFLIKH